MLKALLKKELAQLGRVYFYDSRRKKQRSPAAIAGFVLIMLFAFLSIGMLFYMMADSTLPAIHEAGIDWLYFAFFGLIVLGLGVIGSVFMTNSILYKAKDNELLLSMPIPPARLLFVRMLTVLIISFFFCALVWTPVMIRYDAALHPPFTAVLLQLLLLLALTLLVTVFSCLLGWLVGLFSSRIANKTAATVILSLVFIVGYYVLYFNMRGMIDRFLANLGGASESFSRWGWPLKQLGLGASGRLLPALIFTLFAVVLFISAYAVLSATLVNIMTSTEKVKRSVYRGGREKQGDIASALLMKEFKRFTGSAIYLLNAGLGALIMVSLAVFALIKAGTINEVIDGVLSRAGVGPGIVPLIAFGLICLISSTDCTSASSVSLEGNTLWQLQSMPVDPAEPLMAKLRLHLLVNAVPAAILALVLGVVIKAGWLTTVLLVAASCCFVWLCGAFGLMMNLKKPLLDWTNETVPVKQGMAVLFTMLFGFIGGVVLTGLGILLASFAGPAAALAVAALIAAGAALAVTRWIKRSGAGIFAELS